MKETETTATVVQDSASPAAPAQTAAQQPGFGGMLMPMLLLLGLFYFMMIRPQQRKEKERRKMIDETKAGAKVIFAGGIVGTVVEATEKTFIVETAPGTRMEILRACVQGIAGTEETK
jgi:preprotein translocase subunit YajC